MSESLPINDPVLVFATVAMLILLAPIVMGRWRMPGMIGLLLAGALLGPNALGVLARDQSFVLFGAVGLLYIMFTEALEIGTAVRIRDPAQQQLVYRRCTAAPSRGADARSGLPDHLPGRAASGGCRGGQ